LGQFVRGKFAQLSKLEQEQAERQYHQFRPREFDQPMIQAKKHAPRNTKGTEILNSKGERVFLYDRHMLEIDDLAYLIIKSHLLVEVMLDILAHSTFAHPKYLDKLELSFRPKALVVRAAVLAKSADSHWDLIIKLHALRNKFAHSLEPDVKTKLQDLFNTHDGIYRTSGKSMRDSDRLREVVLHCMEFLGSLNP
jgi:hypothetical protein